MPTDHTDLQGRRVDAVRAWTAFVEQGDGAEGLVRPEILHSWQRSGAALTSEVTEAPLADESETAAFWNGSPLQTAVSRVESELRRTAEDGDLVIAVTDAETRVLWTYGGRVMRRKAESVNFVPGGRWDDASVGTNALDLANRVGAPSMVFSAEHYASIVHNWVCWAAPVHDPVDRRAARRHRPVDDLGPHPPDRAGHRPRDGPADRDRDARTRASTQHAAGDVARPARARAAPARRRRGPARRSAAAAQPPADRDPRPARDAPGGAVARAPARAALRRPVGDAVDAQGRGLPPAFGARRPALVAPLPADDAGEHRRRRRCSACCARARCGRPSRRTAATCCPAPTHPR